MKRGCNRTERRQCQTDRHADNTRRPQPGTTAPHSKAFDRWAVQSVNASLPNPKIAQTPTAADAIHTLPACPLTEKLIQPHSFSTHTFDSQPAQLGGSQGPQGALEGSKRSPDCSHDAHICSQEQGSVWLHLPGSQVSKQLHDAHICSQGEAGMQVACYTWDRCCCRWTTAAGLRCNALLCLPAAGQLCAATQQLLQDMTHSAQNMHAARLQC